MLQNRTAFLFTVTFWLSVFREKVLSFQTGTAYAVKGWKDKTTHESKQNPSGIKWGYCNNPHSTKNKNDRKEQQNEKRTKR